MISNVQKWGNSLALRIPMAFAKDAHLHQGSSVDISLVRGRIIVKPKGRNTSTLSQLLKGITKSNLHPELDWGQTLGQEIL